MQALAKPCIYLAMLAAIVGGISRILVPVLGMPSRLYAGAAVILLLLAIAINTSPKS